MAKVPCWSCHRTLPRPPGADFPGSWLRCALGTSRWAARGPMGGCGAAVRPGRSRRSCAFQHPGGQQRALAALPRPRPAGP
eukprot:scaffold117131_cov48-Phaeocystis_antarctica.AAC.4